MKEVKLIRQEWSPSQKFRSLLHNGVLIIKYCSLFLTLSISTGSSTKRGGEGTRVSVFYDTELVISFVCQSNGRFGF